MRTAKIIPFPVERTRARIQERAMLEYMDCRERAALPVETQENMIELEWFTPEGNK